MRHQRNIFNVKICIEAVRHAIRHALILLRLRCCRLTFQKLVRLNKTTHAAGLDIQPAVIFIPDHIAQAILGKRSDQAGCRLLFLEDPQVLCCISIILRDRPEAESMVQHW